VARDNRVTSAMERRGVLVLASAGELVCTAGGKVLGMVFEECGAGLRT